MEVPDEFTAGEQSLAKKYNLEVIVPREPGRGKPQGVGGEPGPVKLKPSTLIRDQISQAYSESSLAERLEAQRRERDKGGQGQSLEPKRFRIVVKNEQDQEQSQFKSVYTKKRKDKGNKSKIKFKECKEDSLEGRLSRSEKQLVEGSMRKPAATSKKQINLSVRYDGKRGVVIPSSKMYISMARDFEQHRKSMTELSLPKIVEITFNVQLSVVLSRENLFFGSTISFRVHKFGYLLFLTEQLMGEEFQPKKSLFLRGVKKMKIFNNQVFLLSYDHELYRITFPLHELEQFVSKKVKLGLPIASLHFCQDHFLVTSTRLPGQCLLFSMEEMKGEVVDCLSRNIQGMALFKGRLYIVHGLSTLMVSRWHRQKDDILGPKGFQIWGMVREEAKDIFLMGKGKEIVAILTREGEFIWSDGERLCGRLQMPEPVEWVSQIQEDLLVGTSSSKILTVSYTDGKLFCV